MVYHDACAHAHAHAHVCVHNHDDGHRDDRHDSHLGKKMVKFRLEIAVSGCSFLFMIIRMFVNVGPPQEDNFFTTIYISVIITHICHQFL